VVRLPKSGLSNLPQVTKLNPTTVRQDALHISLTIFRDNSDPLPSSSFLASQFMALVASVRLPLAEPIIAVCTAKGRREIQA